MTDTHKETGYTLIQREKKRVPISDYGKSAKAERAKAKAQEELKQLFKPTRVEK